MTVGQQSVEKSARVDAPPEAVFAQFRRPAQFVSLLPSLDAIEASGSLDGGDQRLELVYSTAGIPTETDAILTHQSPPRMLRYELVGDADGEIVWEFGPVDDGTEIRCRLTYVLAEEIREELPVEFAHRYNEREVSSLVSNLARCVQPQHDQQ